MKYLIRITDRIASIPAADWNRLGVAPYPFLRHEFLHALEQHDCLGERHGWLPRHIIIFDDESNLLAAAPLYLKFNSYGEFVFDHAWANAYRNQGLSYYPKLVSASPYTPATGPKLLLAPGVPAECQQLLIDTALALAEKANCSSLHWLFTPEKETDTLIGHGFMRRTGCQFHWTNKGYRDFDDYLAALTSSKRKNIKRERRRVTEANVSFQLLNGHTAKHGDWEDFHQLYESTFEKLGGIPSLSLDFFEHIATEMPDSVLLVQAHHQGQIVAAAFNLVGTNTLYGRHWGCREEFDSLHFEACYYQGLNFCIENGLQRFEPGAQGEHKISRGFLPAPTWSAHWLANEQLTHAVGDFLRREESGMHRYTEDLQERSPFKLS